MGIWVMAGDDCDTLARWEPCGAEDELKVVVFITNDLRGVVPLLLFVCGNQALKDVRLLISVTKLICWVGQHCCEDALTSVLIGYYF